MHFDPKALAEELKKYVVEIRFVKANGETRVMRATLKKESLPVQEDTGTAKQLLLESEDPLFTVWDIDARGWRSFHLNSVQSIQTLDVV